MDPKDITSTVRVKTHTTRSPDFSRHYATSVLAGIYGTGNDFRLTFYFDEASELQCRLNNAKNQQGKQDEISKGLNIVEVCEVVLPVHVAKKLSEILSQTVVPGYEAKANKKEYEFE